MARALQTASLSFGLVNIPIKLYTAATSKSVHFHMLHAKDGSRVHQQLVCNAEEKVVTRKDIVKGYEVHNGKYVEVSEKELNALEAEANRNVEIAEFVPLEAIDPVYFEKTYYLGPDKGGEKPYRLLTKVLHDKKCAAIAQFVMRGKENLVVIRPSGEEHLLLNVLYYADEVREMEGIEVPKAKVSTKEVGLAANLVEQLLTDTWKPEKYQDSYRQRVLELIRRKEKGEEMVEQPPEKQAPVLDLMAALKRSLEKTPSRQPRRRAARPQKAARTQHRKAG